MRRVSSCHQGALSHCCKGPTIHDQRGMFLPWQWVAVKWWVLGRELRKQSSPCRHVPFQGMLFPQCGSRELGQN